MNPIRTLATLLNHCATGSIAMIRLRHLRVPAVLLLAWLSLPAALAQDARSTAFGNGIYLSPMAVGVFPVSDHAPLKNGYGGTFSVGYRNDWYAVEIAPSYADLKHAEQFGAAVRGLLFPFHSNVYALLGVEGLDYSGFDTPTRKNLEFNTVNLDAGVGTIWPLSVGLYDFGIRSEAIYRYGERERQYNDADTDIDAPRYFKQVVVNVGLYLPLGRRQPVAPPAAVEPVVVVPPAAACSDGIDNDGDGKIDFPADPGCTSAQDNDESDPAQCSDGIDNDGDGKVDFPADPGCTSAEDNDETDPVPPCKTPTVGEKVSLKGCGTGDVIVLRGVNFDFDQASLTANAKTILDDVANELRAYPDIHIELGGHTDAKGSDRYNQRLSDQRAASVMKYLVKKGVAADRMTSVGYGESKPVASNETDEGRELNRRVELKVTAGVAANASKNARPVTSAAPIAKAAGVAATDRELESIIK